LKFIAKHTTFIALSADLKHTISEILELSRQFNSSDVLVHVDDSNKNLVFAQDKLIFHINDFPKKILQDTNKRLKESGVNSLCIAKGTVSLELNGKKVESPILLSPLHFKIDKIKNTISFTPVEADTFLNPFVESQLKKLGLDTHSFQLESIAQTLVEKGLNVRNTDVSIFGNFHHHRYAVIRELEELLEKDLNHSNVSSLFGYEKNGSAFTLELSGQLLLEADVDHDNVFESIKNENVVVQGPPGTGKSQVLTNILSKLMLNETQSIMLSEKRVALEVIEKKLAVFGLDKLSFIASADNMSHVFLQDLKRTWGHFEAFNEKPFVNLGLSKQYLDNLQMTLDLLNQEKLIGGVSYHAFKEYSKGIDFCNAYSSVLPDINDYISQKKTLELIYSNNINESIGAIKPRRLQEDAFLSLDQKINEWLGSIQLLSKIFSINSWSDLQTMMKLAAQCQVYENDLVKKYAGLFRANSRAQKKFLSLRKRYLKAEAQIERAEQNHSHWKILPSKLEVESLKTQSETNGFFAKRKLKKRWEELSTMPFESMLGALSSYEEEIKIKDIISQFKIDFCDLGIESIEIDVPLIYQTINLYNEDQWRKLEGLDHKTRNELTEQHSVLEALFNELSFHFEFTNEVNIQDYLSLLKEQFSLILTIRDQLKELNKETLYLLRSQSNIEEFERVLYGSHWTHFQERFPTFSGFEIQEIHEKVDQVTKELKSESQVLAKQIEERVHQRFNAYHDLLNTPARKLKPEEKKLKSRLRKGKSILVKEFAKTRSHPTLRELFNSEAREWIQLLKPIWLSNPTQLSKCFPLEKDLFDVAIFDEASQIPLQNGLGAIHRSKRVIIAGDEHQMGPSNYFKAGTTEVVDLLHQGSYNWNKIGLKHHYRSAHPELIAFSNRHFYNNELSAYPSFNPQNPINDHYVKDGKFIERRNVLEAKSIAKKVKESINANDSIGVVAFSEEQLACIWNEFDSTTQELLSNKIQQNQGFFKALENVQGDECDHLFISFGYGKDDNEDFHMRFGPMNTSNGRKRLNVLLTRAKHTIHFFSSVRHSDFKLSENESINLLRSWFAKLELTKEKEAIKLPFSLDATIEGREITFRNIQKQLPNAKEVVTLQNVMQSRGWNVNYA
jgi:hypothetical protein